MIALGNAYGSIQIGTGEAERNVNSLADSMKKVGGTLTAAISAPLIGIGAAGLAAAAGFEQSMNQVAVVSGATESAMVALNAKALQLGRDTSFSAGEAAQGMLELSKAGLDAEQTMAAISGVLDLAAAGGLGVGQAAEIASNALNTFKLPASEANRVANLLAAAANSSSVEVTDMAYAFQMAGAVFASNGQQIDDLSTAIAILGNNGIKGSDAGTSLKTMMMRLAAPTDKAAAVMQEMGLQVYNADGSMRSFQDIVASLTTATASYSAEQRNAAFNTIFGADAIRAANILVDTGTEAYAEMRDNVNEAGAATTVAEARMKGLAGAIAYAKGTIESTLIAAFQPMLDMIGGLIRGAADLFGAFGQLPEPIRNAAIAFGAVLAAAGPLMMAIPAIGSALAALTSPIGAVAVAVAALAAAWAADFLGIRTATLSAWEAIQPTLTRWGGAVRDLWDAIQWIFTGQADNIDWWWDIAEAMGFTGDAATQVGNMLFDAGVQIGAALTVIRSTATNFGDIMSDLRDALEWLFTGQADNIDWWWDIAEAMGFTGEAAMQVGRAMYDAGVRMGTSIQSARTVIESAWAAISNLFGPGIARIQESLGSMSGSFAELGPNVGSLGTAFQNLWTALQPVISNMIQGFTMIAQVWGALVVGGMVFGVNLIAGVLNNLPAIIGVVIDQITLIVESLSTIVTEAVTLVKAILAGDWTTAWNSASAIVTTVFTLISGTIGNFIAFAVIVFNLLRNTIIATLTDLGASVEEPLDTLAAYWESTWTAIQDAWNAVFAAIVGTWAALVAWLVGTFPTALEAARASFAEKFEQIRSAVEQRLNPILGMFTTMKIWLETTLPNAFTALADFLKTLNIPNPLQGISTALDKVKSGVLGLPAAFNALKDKLTGFSIPNPFSGLEPPQWYKDLMGYAVGSSMLPGGLAVVGERGPELMVTPPGGKILTNGQTNRRLAGEGGMGGDVIVNITGNTIASTLDMRQLAYEAAKEFKRMRL